MFTNIDILTIELLVIIVTILLITLLYIIFRYKIKYHHYIHISIIISFIFTSLTDIIITVTMTSKVSIPVLLGASITALAILLYTTFGGNYYV